MSNRINETDNGTKPLDAGFIFPLTTIMFVAYVVFDGLRFLKVYDAGVFITLTVQYLLVLGLLAEILVSGLLSKATLVMMKTVEKAFHEKGDKLTLGEAIEATAEESRKVSGLLVKIVESLWPLYSEVAQIEVTRKSDIGIKKLDTLLTHIMIVLGFLGLLTSADIHETLLSVFLAIFGFGELFLQRVTFKLCKEASKYCQIDS